MESNWKERRLYHLYMYMLKRCFCATTPNFHRYGGRGITVCERWRIQPKRGLGFRNFKADLGPRPDGYSLERLNNDGNYTPENCKWVPRFEQYRNRSTNRWIEFNGVRMIAKDWQNETGVRADVIVRRIKRGVEPEIAIFDTGNLHFRDTTAMIAAAAKKKNLQTHCKRGHPLSGDNLHNYTAKNGWTARVCRTCKRESMREYRK